MADVLLFGATGYTGKLTAAALHRRGASFAIAGRNRAKLERLAGDVGGPPVHVIEPGDVAGLTEALEDAKVLLTCVGPFVEHGHTAVEAALRAGVHYIDSTGEGTFIDDLISRHNDRAMSSALTFAPAMGFDEVPGDVAVARACEGLEEPSVTVTYALPRTASTGTVRSALGILSSTGPFIHEGGLQHLGTGDKERWSPMPPPLGPRRAVCFPLALLRLAPLRTRFSSFETFVTIGEPERIALKIGKPFLGLASKGPVAKAVETLLQRRSEGPTEEQRQRGRWTILVEARSADAWRNVVITGNDVYGLTAETLSAGAIEMALDGYAAERGVVSPVQAAGVDTLQTALEACGAQIETYEPV